ncbi:LysE family translocator [Aquitalea sp. LB_tupeE]|uniref:LysE family translocator n=1 Tax=Aquitalea sp. LB_tupeE TaxID=2748078 RepID=UPI0015BD08CA|nr:LysE family transporter [Aquitalea sp. LB_tupeE]NWK78821.1 LysE family transporter [Aquitalea sp. LB_tupeE]
MNVTLLTLFVVYMTVMITPGPNFMVVAQTSTIYGWKNGILTATGVSAGSSILAILAITGVTSFLLKYSTIYISVKLLGISYLLYISYRFFMQGRNCASLEANNSLVEPVNSFSHGLLTNLTNPKALMFFITVFTSILDLSTTYALKIKCIAMISLCSFVWHFFLAIVFSLKMIRKIFSKNFGYVCYGSSVIIFIFSILLVRTIF